MRNAGYRRVGDHARATASNYAAVAADLAYIRQTPATARSPLHYLSHNLHFITVSLIIEGRESEALAAAQQLFENASRWGDDPYNHLHNQTLVDVKQDLFFTVPIEAIARFRRWDALLLAEVEEALAAAPAGDNIPFTRVMWRYAEALRYIDVGPVAGDGAGARLDAFRSAVDRTSRDLRHGNNRADDLFRIAHLVLLARALEALPAGDQGAFIEAAASATASSLALGPDADLFAERDPQALIIAMLGRAVAHEDALDYNEPAEWYFPGRESPGAALYRQEKFAVAETGARHSSRRHGGTPPSSSPSTRCDRPPAASGMRRRHAPECDTIGRRGGRDMAKAIHMMVRVQDEARSIAFYSEAFGLEIADRFDFDDFTLVYLRNPENDFEVELTVNKGREAPYQHGDGYGHIAFAVDDLDAEQRRFREAGLAPGDIKEFFRDGSLMARFFFVQDPDGYKIEVLQRHGRYR